MKKSGSLLLVLFVLFVQQATAQLKPLQLEDYSRWSRIVSPELSSDGNWFRYSLRPNGGDDTLYVKNLKDDTEIQFPNALSAGFSENSGILVFMTRPDKKESDKLRKARKAIPQTAHLVALATDTRLNVENANSMQLSNNENYWAVHKKKAEEDKTKHKGSDLVLFDIKTGRAQTIGNVSEYAFNQTGNLLAYVVDANEKLGNGVFVMNLQNQTTLTLDADTAMYQRMVWDDTNASRAERSGKGSRIAVLKAAENKKFLHLDNTLMVFAGLPNTVQTYKLEASAGAFPEDFVISEQAAPQFSNDGNAVFFGFKEQEPKVKMSKDTIPNVDVWHWKDDRIQTVQIRQAARDRNFTYRSAFRYAQDVVVRLAEEELKTVLPSKHNRYQVGRDETPYISDVNWGVSPADLYRVDLTTGERIKFAELVNRPLGYSPDGAFYLFQKDTALVVYDLAKNKSTVISAKAPVVFMDLKHPYPHEKPPYGVAGWTKDKKHVIVNHDFDLWLLALDGSKAENITKNGETQQIRYRYLTLEEEEEWIDTKKPLLLTGYGEWTKKEGVFSLNIGKEPSALLWEDARIRSFQKARDADKVVFVRETFVDFPDYHLADSRFTNPVKITDANPQQSEYAWGRRILVDFENSRGDKLQGTLALPAGYEEGKAYPTIIYFYEKMSDRHHQYSMPVYDDRPHMSTYASNGYMVFMPDIVFQEGRPGTSSLDAITSAAQRLIDLGYADPNRIGLQGHSWAGYQTSFILTQTDMFRTIVTGAPPTNLDSFYNNIYGSTGTVHHGIIEIGQVRMGRDVTPWTHREDYNRENPMYHVPNINTPFLILHGTDDGAVDWNQGLELFNAARRMGKEVIFLSYPNEGHHLSNEANQKDFQRRMKEYFDHHLMDKPAPDWMLNGVPHLEKMYNKAE